MATSIYFVESKDFKLIKDRILNAVDDYLVYVYADTSNVKIPREMIMELPRYGNNLIWVDTAEMDASDLSHHIVLTIGQLASPEEELDFYLVSRSSRLDKTIIFLRNQGIAAELISPEPGKSGGEKPKGRRGRPKKAGKQASKTKTGKRGRPKKEKSESVAAETPVKTGKRGRPKKEKPVTDAVADQPKKKRGRPKAEKPAAETVQEEKPVRPSRKKATEGTKPKGKKKPAKKTGKGSKAPAAKGEKSVKPADTRTVDEIVASYGVEDINFNNVLSGLLNRKKVARPKQGTKLMEEIRMITHEDDKVVDTIYTQLVNRKVIEISEDGTRVKYLI